MDHRIKYARLVRRKASSPRAKGADSQSYHYAVQLVLEGKPYQKPKHTPGHDVIGLDVGPSTFAIVPREGEARLVLLCEAPLGEASTQASRISQELAWQASQRDCTCWLRCPYRKDFLQRLAETVW